MLRFHSTRRVTNEQKFSCDLTNICRKTILINDVKQSNTESNRKYPRFVKIVMIITLENI